MEKLMQMEGMFLSKLLFRGVTSNDIEVCKNKDIVQEKINCVHLSMVFQCEDQQFYLNFALQTYETTGYYTMYKYLMNISDIPNNNKSLENYIFYGRPVSEENIYQTDVNSVINSIEIYRKLARNKIDSETYESIEQDHILVFYLDNQKTIAIYPQNDMSGLINVKIVDLYDFIN